MHDFNCRDLTLVQLPRCVIPGRYQCCYWPLSIVGVDRDKVWSMAETTWIKAVINSLAWTTISLWGLAFDAPETGLTTRRNAMREHSNENRKHVEWLRGWLLAELTANNVEAKCSLIVTSWHCLWIIGQVLGWSLRASMRGPYWGFWYFQMLLKSCCY